MVNAVPVFWIDVSRSSSRCLRISCHKSSCWFSSSTMVSQFRGVDNCSELDSFLWSEASATLKQNKINKNYPLIIFFCEIRVNSVIWTLLKTTFIWTLQFDFAGSVQTEMVEVIYYLLSTGAICSLLDLQSSGSIWGCSFLRWRTKHLLFVYFLPQFSWMHLKLLCWFRWWEVTLDKCAINTFASGNLRLRRKHTSPELLMAGGVDYNKLK